MGAPEVFWNPPQGVDHERTENIRISGKNILLAPKRSQLPVSFRTWRQNGANFLTGSSRGSDSEPDFTRKLLSPPYRNIGGSKTTYFFLFFEKLLEHHLSRWGKFILAYLLSTPYSNMRGQKTTQILKEFSSILVPHGFEEKRKHQDETFPFYSCTATSKAKK